MKTFTEKEVECESVFRKEGPYWHLYTDGTVMENVFISDEMMKCAMTALAVEAILNPNVKIITFELMANHIHLILAGSREAILEFFNAFRQRIIRIFRNLGVMADWSKFQASILPIDSLKSLRNEIVYVNRNAFVACSDYTPQNYLWGGGCAYFSSLINLLPAKSVKDIGFNKARQLAKFRDIKLLEKLRFVDDVVYIPSFCRIDIGQGLFRDARSYFYLLTKDAESFSQIAEHLKDRIFLIDEELFAVATKWASEKFNGARLTMLSPEQKVIVAKELHYKYNASNQQLRRLLRLDASVLQELFPY